MEIDIGIIQFPGSNTERETIKACKRVGLSPIEFFWNDSPDNLSQLKGYIIIGGFSYEDRSRAGVIAALDPILDQIKLESDKGKPVLGICNGAQILVESGLVPGSNSYNIGTALTDNKRIINGKIAGVGYYNTWASIKMQSKPNRCAFTRHIKQNDWLNIPLAHGEGRFVIPENNLSKIIDNKQIIFRYCNNSGDIINEFPTNPNGSIYNIAALSNGAGNVLAIMPHPERTKNGDTIFSSMKEFIEIGNPVIKTNVTYVKPEYELKTFSLLASSSEWVINLIITDNEAISVENTLKQLGFDVKISRQSHWEIETNGDTKTILNSIDATGELYNSNKEYINYKKPEKKTITFLVRQKEDLLGRSKLESLVKNFEIEGIKSLKHGTIWNIDLNGNDKPNLIEKILNTNILFNPISYECYRIN
tara:strand:- start:24711 stop:25970 length:1260 start_codon:yes stop_codon:yes gene_type:complete